MRVQKRRHASLHTVTGRLPQLARGRAGALARQDAEVTAVPRHHRLALTPNLDPSWKDRRAPRHFSRSIVQYEPCRRRAVRIVPVEPLEPALRNRDIEAAIEHV